MKKQILLKSVESVTAARFHKVHDKELRYFYDFYQAHDFESKQLIECIVISVFVLNGEMFVRRKPLAPFCSLLGLVNVAIYKYKRL